MTVRLCPSIIIISDGEALSIMSDCEAVSIIIDSEALSIMVMTLVGALQAVSVAEWLPS